MGVADSLLGCVDLATILNMYVKKNNNNIIINARTGSCLEELYI
jgi:flagellar basal body P-ring protein FlgI